MSEKLAVGRWQLPVPGQVAGNWQPATGNCRSGFTLIEILVAIGVATILFGICTTIFVKVSKYKSRSEKLLFMAQDANAVLARIARDIEGLYVGSATDATLYWHLEKNGIDPLPPANKGDRITFLSATENSGKTDFCMVQYYAANSNLYRLLSGGIPSGSWPLEGDSILAAGVESITFSTEPVTTIAGKVPKSVTISLLMSDPDGTPSAPASSRRFTITVRPGSEEN